MDSRLEPRRLDVVLVRTRAEPLSLGLSLVQGVIELAQSSGAMTDTILSTVLLFHWGSVEAIPPSAESRRALVASIVEHFGADVAVLSGEAEWHVGTFGGVDRLNFGPVSEGLNRALRELLVMPLGQATEFGEL